MVLCNVQSAGRGRLGRSWNADAGSLCTSIVLRPAISPVQAPLLTLISGLAVAYAIREVTGITSDLGIKWPNDVILEGRKVCGILTELSTEMERVGYVIVGIGINVNNSEFPEELKDKAGSLLTLTGKSYSRAKLATALINQLMRLYTLFKEQGFSAVRDEYNSLCLNIGKVCESADGKYKGECLGINDEGRLELKSADGSVEKIFSGEVSLRLADGRYI
jgi:BirA family biotin operon repressor/biotin-[acetyl-CoA-carboxylase] ligase